MSELKEILQLLKNLDKRISKIEQLLGSNTKQIKSESLPSRKSVGKTTKKSVIGIIMDMSNDGFFDTPKSFGEIHGELKRRNYYYAKTSLTLPLQNLLRRKALGRMSVSGKWAYVKR